MTPSERSKRSPASWHLREKSSAFLLAEEAAFHCLSKRAEEVVVLDLRGKSDVCDFFVICTGQTDVQVKAIIGAVRDGLAEGGHSLLHAEGVGEGRWGLLDYVDVVVHVFQPRTRQYYLLERLWSDAPRLEITDAHFTTEVVRRRQPRLADQTRRPAAKPTGSNTP